jgi:hypothetical protein
MPDDPIDVAKGAFELGKDAFEFGYDLGQRHNEQADAHHLDVINDNAQREQVLAAEAQEFDPPDVGDFA